MMTQIMWWHHELDHDSATDCQCYFALAESWIMTLPVLLCRSRLARCPAADWEACTGTAIFFLGLLQNLVWKYQEGLHNFAGIEIQARQSKTNRVYVEIDYAADSDDFSRFCHLHWEKEDRKSAVGKKWIFVGKKNASYPATELPFLGSEGLSWLKLYETQFKLCQDLRYGIDYLDIVRCRVIANDPWHDSVRESRNSAKQVLIQISYALHVWLAKLTSRLDHVHENMPAATRTSLHGHNVIVSLYADDVIPLIEGIVMHL